MFKLRLAAAGTFAAAVTVLSSGVAQAYPDCGIALDLSPSTVAGGGSFSFTADAGEVDCDWAVTYAGKTKTGSGTSFSGKFNTSAVTERTTEKITATCTFDDAAIAAPATTSTRVTPAFYSADSNEALQAAIQTCPVSANITLLPKGDTGLGDEADNNGLLPDTGGASFWMLVLGGALVAGGAGVTYASRRRHPSH